MKVADIHVLEAGSDGEQYRIIWHFPVADVTNDAGVNYRMALVRSGMGGSTLLPDGDGTGGTISAAEKAEIEAGIRFEVVKTLSWGKLKSGGTASAELLATLRHFYAQDKADWTNRLQQALQRFGYALNEG